MDAANHQTNKRQKLYYVRLSLVIAICMMLLLAGCGTLPTQRTSLPEASASGGSAADETVDARPLLIEAIETMNTSELAERFWFTGYIRNSLQKHLVTSMFDGVLSRPKEAFIVNARIAAQPFQYYGYGDERFIRKDDGWRRLYADETPSLPFDPFAGFADWLPLLEEAVQRPDEKILGKPSHVLEVRMSAKEWVEQAASPLFEGLDQLAGDGQAAEELAAEMNRILEETIVKTTFWITREEKLITQYQTWIVMPLPGGGYFDQETFFRFYRFGDPSIETTHLPEPEDVLKWVREYDEVLHTEQDQMMPEE